MHEQRVQQETEELRRRNQSRDQVLVRLWQIANLDPEITRNSASAQIKALSMIVAIEGLIPDRRAGSSGMKSAPLPAVLLLEQQENTGLDPVGEEDVPGVPDPPSGQAAASSEINSTRPLATAAAPDNWGPNSTQKAPDTLRLRL
jgi:hypothetical protein